MLSSVSAATQRVASLLYTSRVKSAVERYGYDWTLERWYWTFVYRTGGTVWPQHSESVVLNDILNTVTSDDVFFDVGAAYGVYTWFVGAISRPTVVTFEPYPPALETTTQKVQEGGINAQLNQMALSDTSGTMEFNTAADKDVGTPALATDTTSDDDDTISVEVARGDDVVKVGDAPQPTVVKIDVEGAELDVINGMRTTLANKHCHTVYVEVHLPSEDSNTSIEDYGAAPEDVHAALEDLGFSLEILQKRPRDYHIKATR